MPDSRAASAPPTWTSPEEISGRVLRLWNSGQLLTGEMRGEALFPLPVPLRHPEGRQLSDRFEEVRAWIRTLEQGSRATRGFGYEIHWEEIQHRQLGRNRVPVGLSIPSSQDALRLIGKVREAALFRQLAESTLAQFPALREWLEERPLTLLRHAAEWNRILGVVGWFADHPASLLYLRQVDVPGVHTKFIEARRELVGELLNRVLPESAIDWNVSGVSAFEARYGLRSKPVMIRFRVLDPRLRIRGLSDVQAPVSECAGLDVGVSRVFITENEITGVAFPDVPGSLVIFGLGYGVERLKALEWLRPCEVYYWGDLDTNGFAILDRVRACVPQTHSFLMDQETLMAHRELWGVEQAQCDRELTGLNEAERQVYDNLRTNRLGDRVRLEQERISFGWLEQALAQLIVDRA